MKLIFAILAATVLVAFAKDCPCVPGTECARPYGSDDSVSRSVLSFFKFFLIDDMGSNNGMSCHVIICILL